MSLKNIGFKEVEFCFNDKENKYKYPFKYGEVLIMIGEIQNMEGHCVVMNPVTKEIFSGYHIENFRKVRFTKFQKLIVDCKPKINKPVFVLCGAGCGKTYALNERAKKTYFLYYGSFPHYYRESQITENILNTGTDVSKFEELVFEIQVDPSFILKQINTKKVIIFTNGVDFVKNYANRLKGEYTIISGFNINDNKFLMRDNLMYKSFLETLPTYDKKRLLYGDF